MHRRCHTQSPAQPSQKYPSDAGGGGSSRRKRRRQQPPPPPYRVLSLFCGAGGLDAGFAAVGGGAAFTTVQALDSDAAAVATYNANLPGGVGRVGDVAAAAAAAAAWPANIDVVVGGPPCQGFSVAGRMAADDPRSGMVHAFTRVVAATRPRAFVMENVKALAALAKFEAVRAELAAAWEAAGYEVRCHVLNARDYGVAQARERAFFIGVRRGSGVPPVEAVPVLAGTPPLVTVRSVLAPLPPPGTPPNLPVCPARITLMRRPVLRASPYAGMLLNGAGRVINLDGPAPTLPASMGGNKTPVVDEAALRDAGTPPWILGYHAALQAAATAGGSAAAAAAVLPAAPDRLRRLTLHEAALLQGFPAEWVFRGSRSRQFRQVGNAVPPPLAAAVAAVVLAALDAGASAPVPPPPTSAAVAAGAAPHAGSTSRGVQQA